MDEQQQDAPSIRIEKHANVVIGPDRLTFEGGWSFFVPTDIALDDPDVQRQVSLMMIEYAITQLHQAQIKLLTPPPLVLMQ